MTRDRKDLNPEFNDLLTQLLAHCEKHGYTFVPYFTIRAPAVQAKLWRQSRTRAEINATVKRLREQGAACIAHIIESVGPQPWNRRATNAFPGNSWHQWGEAADLYLKGEDGGAIWESPAYDAMREIAKSLGLHLGPVWDKGHVQLQSVAPLEYFGALEALDSALQMRWGWDGNV